MAFSFNTNTLLFAKLLQKRMMKIFDNQHNKLASLETKLVENCAGPPWDSLSESLTSVECKAKKMLTILMLLMIKMIYHYSDSDSDSDY